MTTEAQSVSGMKPMRTSFFSGASEPAAQAPARTPGGTMAISPAPRPRPAAPRRNSRRDASASSKGFLSISRSRTPKRKGAARDRPGGRCRGRRCPPPSRRWPSHVCSVATAVPILRERPQVIVFTYIPPVAGHAAPQPRKGLPPHYRGAARAAMHQQVPRRAEGLRAADGPSRPRPRPPWRGAGTCPWPVCAAPCRPHPRPDHGPS